MKVFAIVTRVEPSNVPNNLAINVLACGDNGVFDASILTTIDFTQTAATNITNVKSKIAQQAGVLVSDVILWGGIL